MSKNRDERNIPFQIPAAAYSGVSSHSKSVNHHSSTSMALFIRLVEAISLLLAIAALQAGAPRLYAQTTASLTGSVTDTTGAVVPGAQVTAINQATQDKTKTVTSNAGTYTFPVLLPGTYTLSVEARGYQTSNQTGLALVAGARVVAPAIVLRIGSVTQTVTVQTNSQVLQTESGQLGAVLDTKDIDRMALVSRNTLELLKTLPGVTTSPNFTSNGLGFDFNNIGAEGSPIGTGLATNGVPNRGGTADLLDGVNINDPGCNCWSIALVDPDMTQEVSYQSSNFGADISHGPVVVNSISKSGTADYHGEGYFYARNDVLNANDWVSNHEGLPRGQGHYYYPGGNVGGPVPFTHKKLLFWFGYERFLQNTGNASSLESHIPTSAMMSGDFSSDDPGNVALCAGPYPGGIGPGNAGSYCNDLTGTYLPNGAIIGVTPGYPAGHIPVQYTAAGDFAPAQFAAALAKIWPTPNATPSSGNGWSNFYEAIPGIHDGYIWRGRVDYDFSDATKLYVTYQYGTDSAPAQGNGAHIYWTPANAIPFPGGALQSLETSKVLSGHFTHIFTPTLTNELVGSVGYANNPIALTNPTAVYKTTLGYAGGTIFNTADPWIPSYNSAGTYTFPDFSQQDIFQGGSDYPLLKEAPSAFDNLIKIFGTHTVKVGFFYEMVNNDQGNFNTPNGVYSFNGGPANNVVTGQEIGSPNNPTANFVMGNATSYSENNANPKGDMAYKTMSVYGDDTWRVTSRLSVEYGVRLDHMGRWYDRGDTGIPVFLPNNVASDFAAGRPFPGLSYHAINPGVPKSGMPTPFLVVSPRFGVSYDLYGNGKTVLRGGWGVYRWGDQWGDYSGALSDAQGVKGFNLPGSTTVLLNQVGSGAPGLTPPTATGSSCCAGTAYAVSPDDNTVPTTYSYNFTIDQQVPWNSLVELAYVGNQSTNVLVGGGSGATLAATDFINQNKMPLGALFKPDPVTGVTSPNPENISGPGSPNNKPADYDPFGYAYGTSAIYVVNHSGYSNYNGFQISWVKRSNHLTFNLNYTRSKTLGTDLNEDPFSLHGNYGVSQIDRPNVFSSSYSYDTGTWYHGNDILSHALNHWMISGITSWQGGGNLQAQDSPNFGMSLTYTTINGQPISSTNPLPAGVSPGYGAPTYYGTTAGKTVQPVLTCDPGSGLASHQHVRANCFAPPAIGQDGLRNFPYLSGPSYTDTDLAISKTTHITERQSITFRASAFNWDNHPLAAFSSSNQLALYFDTDYATKASALGSVSPTYGITDTKTGGDTRRIIELALKYNF